MSGKFHGLGTRAVTGAIAAIVALGATIAHPYSFIAMLIVGFAIAIREWERLNIAKRPSFLWLGILYLAIALAALAWLRLQPFNNGDRILSGPYWVLGLFALVWTTDIGAYACGRLIGGPKIAPTISPNKTWAGLLGAMALTALISYLLSRHIPDYPPLLAIALGLLIAVVAQAGDFLESALKRRAGVKDSGTLLPGHGGLLDRIDGLLPASLFFALAVYLHLNFH